ncbi:class I SAM-dependent methyltransferase [Inquilinus limosus]|uniref:class I SAM-dependent methyltransferase n=1 Tax=Inquilinus limosus TaxID=171674 RepID=UPI003F1431A4
MLRAQTDPRGDNGSRRVSYLGVYCEPLQQILNGGQAVIVHPGCGCGQWASFLSRYPYRRYIGFDRSELIIDHARRAVADSRVSFYVGDVLSLPKIEADLILLDYEFLNAFDLDDAMRIVEWSYRSLRDGGTVFGDLRPFRHSDFRNRRFIRKDLRRGRLVWAEFGNVGNAYFGRQALVFDTERGRLTHQCQDFIRLFSSREVKELFSVIRWRAKNFTKIDYIETDKQECRNNIRFFLCK